MKVLNEIALEIEQTTRAKIIKREKYDMLAYMFQPLKAFLNEKLIYYFESIGIYRLYKGIKHAQRWKQRKSDGRNIAKHSNKHAREDGEGYKA